VELAEALRPFAGPHLSKDIYPDMADGEAVIVGLNVGSVRRARALILRLKGDTNAG